MLNIFIDKTAAQDLILGDKEVPMFIIKTFFDIE
jgi:hypothetical protein